MVALTPVANSKLVEAAGYDPATSTLALRFKSGGATHHYKDVPPNMAEAFGQAESPGSFFHQNIKGQFESEKIPDGDEAGDE